MSNNTQPTRNYDATFEHDFQMLNYFQEEFKYRHQHYWEILIKLFTFTIGVTVLPVISGVFGLNLSSVPRSFLICFPGIGAMLSLFSFFILYDKAKKLSAIGHAKYRVNVMLMDPKYHYEFYNKAYLEHIQNNTDHSKSAKHKLLAYKMIWIKLIVEWFIIIPVFIILFSVPQTITL